MTLPELVFQVVHWNFAEEVGAMLVQIAHDGDPDLLLMLVNVLNQCAMRPAIWAHEVRAMEIDQIASAAIERARTG